MALSDILRLTGGIWEYRELSMSISTAYLSQSFAGEIRQVSLSRRTAFVRVYCYYYPSRTSARSYKVLLLHDSSILLTTNGLPTRTISETNSLKADKTIQFVLRTRARPVRYMYIYLEDLVSFFFFFFSIPIFRRTGTCNNCKEARGRVSNY